MQTNWITIGVTHLTTQITLTLPLKATVSDLKEMLKQKFNFQNIQVFKGERTIPLANEFPLATFYNHYDFKIKILPDKHVHFGN